MNVDEEGHRKHLRIGRFRLEFTWLLEALIEFADFEKTAAADWLFDRIKTAPVPVRISVLARLRRAFSGAPPRRPEHHRYTACSRVGAGISLMTRTPPGRRLCRESITLPAVMDRSAAPSSKRSIFAAAQTLTMRRQADQGVVLRSSGAPTAIGLCRREGLRRLETQGPL